MRIEASNPEEYVSQLDLERQVVIQKLRSTIKENLPKGFTEEIQYGMIAYVVPLTLYPAGYHCKVSEPLPFISLASQKNFIALYHMGMYAKIELLDWFTQEYPKYCKRKLDMGKSCIRFKKLEDIPYDLIAELVQKMTVEQWIQIYEENFNRK